MASGSNILVHILVYIDLIHTYLDKPINPMLAQLEQNILSFNFSFHEVIKCKDNAQNQRQIVIFQFVDDSRSWCATRVRIRFIGIFEVNESKTSQQTHYLNASDLRIFK